MVELVEEMQRNFRGEVIEAELIPATEKYGSQYKLVIHPTENSEMKDQFAWVSIPRSATESRVPKKSSLGFLISELTRMGLIGETHEEVILGLRGKVFVWKDFTPKIDGENITKKDKLFPVELVE